MTPKQFYDLTPREFGNMFSGFMELEKERNKVVWEVNRQLASTLLLPHVKNKSQVEPKKVWQFAWDKKETQSKPMSKERLIYLSKKRKNGSK